MQAQNAKTKINIEKAVLVGLITQDQSEEQLFENLKELKFLAETGGIYSEETFYQRLRSPDRKTYVGKGKLEEIKIFIDSYNIDMVIFDD